MSYSIMLSDVISSAGLNPDKVVLMRHSRSSDEFKPFYKRGMIKEYTQVQGKPISSKPCTHILVFISDSGTSAIFHGCYEIMDVAKAIPERMPENFPVPDWFTHDYNFYDIKLSSLMQDLQGRLIIDWGLSTRQWKQRVHKDGRDKPILAIQDSKIHTFMGFENLILSFSELSEIVRDPIVYESWHVALKSIYAIYLITDGETGKQYVGSASGDVGLLNRWKCYTETKHGNNKRLIELLQNDPDRYLKFQFSILQILPKTITSEDVIQYENLYKEKLMTKRFGYNDN